MPEAAAILARLDAIMREVAALRAEIAAFLPAPVVEGNGADDFAPEHLIERIRCAGCVGSRPAAG